MIFKMRTCTPSAVGPDSGWIWVDDVAKVQDHGYVMVDGPTSDHPVETGTFSSQTDLARAVDRMWGPMADRQFYDELWPEFASDAQPCVVRCVTLQRPDRTIMLALIHTDTFLLDGSGRTIERLY